MQPMQVDRAENSRLRFVFDDTVISFSLAADVTLGEIARRWGEISRRRYRKGVAVDVILGLLPGDRCAG
jgi:hypothetical protein